MHSDLGHAKSDKCQKNEAKTMRTIDEIRGKK
jgi:hypothetical protein